MSFNRVSATLFVEDPAAIGPGAAEFIPVFHGWIQRQAVDGLPIDVADYGHVPEGPGVLLIGHAADRALDLSEGRPGFTYTTKRQQIPSAADHLALAIAGAVAGAALLEREPALEGAVRFRTGELRITILDRLNAPNTPETFDLLAPEIAAAVARVAPEATVETRQIGESDRPFQTAVALEGIGALTDLDAARAAVGVTA
jgi:hypothetical protein